MTDLTLEQRDRDEALEPVIREALTAQSVMGARNLADAMRENRDRLLSRSALIVALTAVHGEQEVQLTLLDYVPQHREDAVPEPVAEPVVVPVVQPQPECVSDVFRVSRCVDGKILEWF